MQLKYRRDHNKSLEQDIEDIRNGVPTHLVYVGHDNNYIHMLDAGYEEQQMEIFKDMSKE